MRSYLSNNLKFLRSKNKLSQQQVSNLLDIKRITYSKYEEKVNVPSILTLFKIRKLYHLNSIDDLVFTNLKKQLKK